MGSLEHLERYVLSTYKKEDVKIIRLIGNIKFHGKHCQIQSNTKPSLCCICICYKCSTNYVKFPEV